MSNLHPLKIRHWIGLIVGLPALGSSGCDLSAPRTEAEHLAKAQVLHDRNDLKGSIIEFKNALQKNPDNGMARAQLGRIQAEAGNGAAAEKELRRAIELGVPKTTLLKPLAEALRLQGKHRELLAEIIPDETAPPVDRAVLIAWRGDAWLTLAKPDQAQDDYQQALRIDAKVALGRLGLARLAALRNNLDEAKRLAAEALAIAPENPDIWNFQAGLWEHGNDLEKAEEGYSRAMALRRFNQEDRIDRALVRINRGKYTEARDDIEVLKREAPTHYLTHYADGLLGLRQGKFSEAQAALENAERLNDQFQLTKYHLGLAHLGQNHFAQAEQYLSRFLQAAPHSLGGIELLALAKFKKREFASVKNLLVPVLASRAEDVLALKLMGHAEIGLGHIPEGIEYLQKAVELDPDSASTRQGLGLGLLARGEEEKGLAELEAAAELSPGSVQPEIWIALVHLRARQFDQALATISRIRTKAPDGEIADNLLGRLCLAQNDLPAAREAFTAALRKKPGDPAIGHQLAQLALRENHPDEARRFYDSTLKAHPGHLPTEIELARLDALEGKFKQLAERLETVIKENPDALPPRLILAEYLLRLGQPNRAQILLQQIQPHYPRHRELLGLLVQAQRDSGQARLALNTAKTLAEVDPKSAKAYYLLALAQGDNGHPEAMRQNLERARTAEPGFVPARQAEVRLLALEKKYPQAEAELDALLREHPEDPEILNLKGWYATIRGQSREAVEAYRQVLEKAPGTRAAIQLARAQWRTGDRPEAIESLEKWADSHPEDSLSRYLLAGLYREANRPDDARKQLDKVLEINPNNVPALNDLAWLLRTSNPARALELAERAADTAPRMPLVLDTLGTILLDRGQHARAVDVLKRAVELDPRNPSIGFRWALALHRAGRTEDALKSVRGLLAGGQQFPERKDAQDLLKRMMARAGN